ncbi:MAG: hypothetical protein P8J33_03765 [Pirellulaceae bacterium]|nr:hypothetical protein [Pirellulaceae bacterium]
MKKIKPRYSGNRPARAISLILTFAFCCCGGLLHGQQTTSLLGKPLDSPSPNAEILEKLNNRQKKFTQNPNADNLIWLGRFQAYSGDYLAAIKTFTTGIEQFPQDARMRRHRGHRYITLRQFDKAIEDFDKAIPLIEGQPNPIEPDGMPNPKNIPISTLHGNIYYHKGLAHYLKGEWPEALDAYQTCQQIGKNDDNLVSSGHWIYCILQRMGKPDAADESLENIQIDMNIIENHSYHRACLYYKKLISRDELFEELDQSPSGDSLKYAYANWLQTAGKAPQEAELELKKIISSDGWPAFGHIAAEADLARKQKQ